MSIPRTALQNVTRAPRHRHLVQAKPEGSRDSLDWQSQSEQGVAGYLPPGLTPFERKALSLLAELASLLRSGTEMAAPITDAGSSARFHPARGFKFVAGEGAVEIDDAAHVVRRNGVEIDLTPKEYELLIALARREGAPVSQEILRNEVWKGRISPASRTIAQHVVELRKKLEVNPRKPRMLRTASKYGYSLKGCAVSGARV